MSLQQSLVFAADFSLTFSAQYRQHHPITLDLSSGSEISTLDPAIASDAVSITPIQNLFLSLTDIDPVTYEIRPELATNWDVSDDGLVWTFHLRHDVNWMRYDPVTGEAARLRPVVAEDFVFGIKRACDPRFGGYYGTVLATVLAGCDVVNETPDENVTDDLVFGDTTQVVAIDDITLEIRLQFAASYFLSMTTMWMMSPLPKEIVDEFGDDWTAPGNIVTNGPYFLEENIRGVRRSFVRNDGLPSDLFRDGNIERITITKIEDVGTGFVLYQDNQLDMALVPAAELQAILESSDYADQLDLLNDEVVYFFAYTHDKPPFDNVHARRAFSAIVDREAFIRQIRQGNAMPMNHFTPPGMVNSPPINEIGIGFDPDYAREELALAGYPNCEGFPNIDIKTYTGAGTWAEFWAAAAEEYLNCDPALFNIEQLEFRLPIEIPSDPDQPIKDRPNVWTGGWASDYPDADGWIRQRLHCEADVELDEQLYRQCSETDTLMEAAASEPDPERRAQLYLELEERLFGEEGEFPIVPIFVRSTYFLHKPWYSGPFATDGIFGANHWETWSVDMAAKLAARESR
jgi:oligopeptide transport system substrate-binding protein